MKVKRKIIHIDEELCDGCGACVPSCAEGALQVVGGKARLVKDVYCDGLGDCIGECPRGALTIEEREAEEFDERAVASRKQIDADATEIKFKCPGLKSFSIDTVDDAAENVESGAVPQFHLGQWPVQLSLISPASEFLRGRDLFLIADCVPYCVPDFHARFLKGNAVAMLCPKFDDTDGHLVKLRQIIETSGIRSLNVIRMEVPCCSGMTRLAQAALEASEKQLELTETVISIRGGTIKNER
ncbi:MAG TPA: 4Fe-4S binding protein [bacterium]|nr:4Fe-4S binding protein [bacterium]